MKSRWLLMGCLGFLLIAVPSVSLAQSMEKTSAKLYIQQKEWDKAIEWLQKALAKSPEDAQTHFLLGQVHAEKGQLMEMVQEFDLSKKYDVKNKLKKEKKQMDDMIRHFSAKSYNEGVEAYKQQSYSMAAVKFLQSTQLDPNYTDAHRNLSVAYQLVEQELLNQEPCSDCVEGATKWDAHSLTCIDSNTGQPATKSCCCNKEALPDLKAKIIATMETVIKLQPDSLVHTLVLAEYYNNHNDYASGSALFEQALQKEPGNGKVLARLADTYNLLGKKEDALKTYDRALAAEPDNKDLLYNFGQMYLNSNDYANAITQFSKLVDLDTEDFGANFYLGVAHLKIAEDADKRAREMQDEATTKKQKLNTTKFDSLKAVEKKHSTEAVPFLEKATQMQGGDQPAVWTNLGIAYTRSGDTDKAK